MDKEQERVLVQSFFVKRVQERVLHELFTPKKTRYGAPAVRSPVFKHAEE